MPSSVISVKSVHWTQTGACGVSTKTHLSVVMVTLRMSPVSNRKSVVLQSYKHKRQYKWCVSAYDSIQLLAHLGLEKYPIYIVFGNENPSGNLVSFNLKHGKNFLGYTAMAITGLSKRMTNH